MLENFNSNVELRFKELSPEEKEQKGILGRLYGPIASIVQSTRNGRKYTESLWEKVFKDPITIEMLNNGGIPGELDHPVDREETDSTKIAIMMPEAPTKDKNGQLMGYFDIIDTPCGRIAHALAKYGFNLGISSRGTGDTYIGDDGEETVDEDTYSFTAFDLVLLPACKNARLAMTESLNTNKVNFKKELNESLNNSTTEDRKIMESVLESLNIDFKESESETEEEDDAKEKNKEAGDAGEVLLSNLQESLIENKRLQAQIIELQEKLSVGYAKEISQEQDISKLKMAVRKLSESKAKGDALGVQLNSMKSQLEEKVQECQRKDRLIERYKVRLNESMSETKALRGDLSRSDSKVSELSDRISSLNESVRKASSTSERELSKLNSKIVSLEEEMQIKDSQYAKKIKQSNALVEKYKNVAKESIDRYIVAKATTLGVTTNEVRNRLGENYTFDDIDSVCESLRNYRRNISKLPFSLTESINSNAKVSMQEKPANIPINMDDVVDQSLMNLLNT